MRSLSKSKITLGSPVAFTGYVNTAASCEISGIGPVTLGAGYVDPYGGMWGGISYDNGISHTFTPAAVGIYNYALSCTNQVGSTTGNTVTLEVVPQPAAPPIILSNLRITQPNAEYYSDFIEGNNLNLVVDVARAGDR